MIFGVQEFPFEQSTQHVGDGDAAFEGDDFDPASELRRDVDREPRREFLGPGGAISIMLTRSANQASGSVGRAAKPRCGLASVIAPTLRLRGESCDLARGGGALRRLVGEAAAAGGVREDDALTDPRG